jgi:squalene-hopene/tetraprenyl-beta-curcumene cyclase
VNYVYGTWQVLTGLRAVGADMRAPFIRRAGEWLRSVQKDDGSFGETCKSYEDPSLKGQGESTASQTAWGAMGMMAAFGANDPDVERAIVWLVDTQKPDGNWTEAWFTGTGFPKVFYLRYHLYKLYFPLTALARYRRMKASESAPSPRLRGEAG